MIDDIFADWKTSKFIIAEPELHDFIGEHLVILTDISYWIEHGDRLTKWCADNGCIQEGMAVRVPSDKKLTHFILVWA